VSEPDERLRRIVAADHGLDAEAANFLTGSTLSELEASAAALTKLLGKQHEQEEEQEREAGFFERAAAPKAEQKRALAAIFTGRARQPRDEQGRWTEQVVDFHGGARQSVPPPPETHGQTLMRLLRSGEANTGRVI
jgi:hypothetical protein